MICPVVEYTDDLTTMSYCVAGGMHGDFSLIQHSDDCNLSHFVAADISRVQRTCTSIYLKSFVQSRSVLTYWPSSALACGENTDTFSCCFSPPCIN